MSVLTPISGSFDEASAPVLETERLILRAPRREDARAIAGLANDRRIAENTTRIPHPYRLADAESWIAAVAADASLENFVITVAGEVVGSCGCELRKGLPEIGYWIGAPFRGNGYATEAARAVIDYAFAQRFHPAVHSGARISNPASRRVLEKCSFQWTGVGLYRVRSLGSSVPVDRFKLERATWVSLKNWSSAHRRGKVRR